MLGERITLLTLGGNLLATGSVLALGYDQYQGEVVRGRAGGAYVVLQGSALDANQSGGGMCTSMCADDTEM